MGGMENTSSQAAVAASPQRMMASSQDFRGAQAGFQIDTFSLVCDWLIFNVNPFDLTVLEFFWNFFFNLETF